MTFALALEDMRRPVAMSSPSLSASFIASSHWRETTLSASNIATASYPPRSRTLSRPHASTSPLPELGTVFSNTVAPAARATSAVRSVQLSARTITSRNSFG